jgi:hypothetical protein
VAAKLQGVVLNEESAQGSDTYCKLKIVNSLTCLVAVVYGACREFSLACLAQNQRVFNAMVSFSSSGNTIQVRTLGLLAFLEK